MCTVHMDFWASSPISSGWRRRKKRPAYCSSAPNYTPGAPCNELTQRISTQRSPQSARKGLLPIAMVLFSFTFFTGTMFAGGKLGMAFSFVDMLWVATLGNSLLALYAAVLAFIASRSGLNTVLMGRFCFGEAGSRLSDFLLGFAELGWYAWGTATVAIVLVKLLGLADGFGMPLMVLFGLGFSITAIIGFKGLDLLSRVSVPLMFVLLLVSMYIATRDAGGFAGLAAVVPHETMTFRRQ